MGDPNWWMVILAFGSFAVALTMAISGFVYLTMKLMIDPLKREISEMKEQFTPLVRKVKNGDELQRMMDLTVARHATDCHREKVKEEQARRKLAEREVPAGGGV